MLNCSVGWRRRMDHEAHRHKYSLQLKKVTLPSGAIEEKLRPWLFVLELGPRLPCLTCTYVRPNDNTLNEQQKQVLHRESWQGKCVTPQTNALAADVRDTLQ